MAKKQRWTYKTGEKGRNRVRAYEHPKTGIIFLEFYADQPGSPEPIRKRISTGHRDRDKAKSQADRLAAEFTKAEPPVSEGMTLKRLFDMYQVEVSPEKGESKRKHDARCAEMFLRYLGPNRKPETLNLRDWNGFIRDRRRGKICPAKATPGQSVGNRVIAYDLQWLVAVLNWATLARDTAAGVLLDRNPLRGLKLPKEESPKRPSLGLEQYRAMVRVADRVNPRCRLLLVLCYETGHRVGSVRQLRWADVDLRSERIRWRAENDKIGHEHVTPLSPDALAALEEERQRNPAVGDAWVFPSPKDPSRPCSRNLVRDWWRELEREAGLEHLPQMGWHGLRRAFATDMKNQTSLKDLEALGGWKSSQTLLTCYIKADEGSMRAALAGRKRATAVGS